MIEWARYGTGKNYLIHRGSMSIEPISFDVTEPKRERTSITLDATRTDRVSADHHAYFPQLERCRISTLPAFPVRRPGIKSHLGRGVANYLGKPTDTRLQVYFFWT
jgi:hypothetical protein